MIITAIVPPCIATAVTLSIAIGWENYKGWAAALLGVGGGVLVWFVAALVAKHFLPINRSNLSVYRQLHSRLTLLQGQLDQAKNRLKERAEKEDPLKSALKEVSQCCCLLQKDLADPNATTRRYTRAWIEATGYIELWRLLHQAEEAFILLAPLEKVIAEAWYDQLRLTGSHIDHSEELMDCIRDNLTALDFQLDASLDASRKHLDSENDPKMSLLRERLRYVRHAIDEFRDDRWFGLVQARNRLLKTMALMGCVCFALTALAVIGNAPPDKLVAAAAFFLVGAIVGLFNQLRLDASTETATEDYGLTTTRLFHTPMFSGLAALVGVLVIPTLSDLLNGAVSSVDHTIDNSLAKVITLNTSSLVMAVIFGLSPTVLLKRLHQEAERYKADLRSSASGTRRTTLSQLGLHVQQEAGDTAHRQPRRRPSASAASPSQLATGGEGGVYPRS
jgi:hypothetical protein